MKKVNSILFFLTLCLHSTFSNAQPILNERYGIGDETNVFFSSVIVTDSCYYVNGVHTSSPSAVNFKSSHTKFNLDGSVASQKELAHDTLGIIFWHTSEMLTTLDGNFAQMALVGGLESESAFMFFKINPNGDTISTNYIYDFYEEREEFGIAPYALIQEADSSYFGIMSVQRKSDLRAGVIFYKLDKNGDLLFNTPFYPPADLNYHILRPGSLTKENDSVFVIGATLVGALGVENADERKHSKLIRVNKYGDFLNEYTYWEDKLCSNVNGLTKLQDGGFLYCGRNGSHNTETNGFRYIGRVVKINADYSIDWELTLGDSTGFSRIGLNKILTISDSEFVAVGFMHDRTTLDDRSNYGWLVKFDIHGNKIWERRHLKVPHFEGETNYAIHELYDAEITPDNGFVMVGNSFNFHENEFETGQKGWLLKTDKYGCLVPNCHLIGVEIEPNDTNVKPPVKEPTTWIYPNPTSKSLFYYHHQDEFKGGTAYIYNSAGQMVQKWEITANDITYEVDVSQLAVGSYILKVFNMLGEAIEVDRFVKN
ncbi:MAG: T9SS type A sorting domain-containing protein [Crocinitomix sp.]|nr:T9SS type A sorting domain-containing protein [Crocinitomix sp.]